MASVGKETLPAHRLRKAIAIHKINQIREYGQIHNNNLFMIVDGMTHVLQNFFDNESVQKRRTALSDLSRCRALIKEEALKDPHFRLIVNFSSVLSAVMEYTADCLAGEVTTPIGEPPRPPIVEPPAPHSSPRFDIPSGSRTANGVNEEPKPATIQKQTELPIEKKKPAQKDPPPVPETLALSTDNIGKTSRCPQCKKYVPKIWMHIRVVHPEYHRENARFFCPHCEEQLAFFNALPFQRHVERCRRVVWNPPDRHPKLEESVSCPHCGMFCETAYLLTKHVQTEHAKITEPIFTCSVCRRQYRTANGLGMHWKNPPIGIPACNGELCFPTAGSNEAMESSEESMNGEEAAENSAASNIKLEEPDEPVLAEAPKQVCGECGLRYDAGHKNLLKHYALYHRDLYDDQPKFACKFCDSPFQFPHDMEVHGITCPAAIDPTVKARDPRLSKLVLDCPLCDETQDDPYNLTFHFLQFHNLSLGYYGCQTCGKFFHTATKLHRHWRSDKNEATGQYCSGEILIPEKEGVRRRVEAAKEIKEQGAERIKQEFDVILDVNYDHADYEEVMDLACPFCTRYVQFSEYDEHIKYGHAMNWKKQLTIACSVFRCSFKSLSYSLLDNHKRKRHSHLYKQKGEKSADDAPSKKEQPLSLGDIAVTPNPLNMLGGNPVRLNNLYYRNLYEPTTCPLCFFLCPSYFAFSYHLMRDHPRVPGLFFRCNGCGKSYKGAEGLRSHLIQMEKRNHVRCRDQGCIATPAESVEAAKQRRRKGDVVEEPPVKRRRGRPKKSELANRIPIEEDEDEEDSLPDDAVSTENESLYDESQLANTSMAHSDQLVLGFAEEEKPMLMNEDDIDNEIIKD